MQRPWPSTLVIAHEPFTQGCQVIRPIRPRSLRLEGDRVGMLLAAWIATGLIAWITAAGAVGSLIGRVIAARDGQVSNCQV